MKTATDTESLNADCALSEKGVQLFFCVSYKPCFEKCPRIWISQTCRCWLRGAMTTIFGLQSACKPVCWLRACERLGFVGLRVVKRAYWLGSWELLVSYLQACEWPGSDLWAWSYSEVACELGSGLRVARKRFVGLRVARKRLGSAASCRKASEAYECWLATRRPAKLLAIGGPLKAVWSTFEPQRLLELRPAKCRILTYVSKRAL